MSVCHIYIDDIITSETLKEVKGILAQNAAAERIKLHVASPGGSVYAGYNIYHALKLTGKPISTTIEGEAQSMATFIAMAGDEIEICDPSMFMIHMPSSEVQGTSEDMRQGAIELETIEKDMIEAYARKTGLSTDAIAEMMRKTTRLNAQQAVDMKFVDKKLSHYMRAVALGKSKIMKDNPKTFAEKIIALAAPFLGTPQANGPQAIDLQTQDGKVLNVMSEDGELEGKPATVDGQPAQGTYPLKDGRSITCEGGMVVSVQEAQSAAAPAPAAPPAQPNQAAPAPAPTQSAAEQQLAAQVAVMKAEKEAAEAKAAAAIAEKATAVQALAQINTEMQQQLAGDPAPPSRGTGPTMKAKINSKQREEVMVFMATHMPWILDRYPAKDVEKYALNPGPMMISILETNFNYTYPGILTTDIYYKPTLGSPALSDIFTIDQGIKDKKRYNLVNSISKILKPYTGCDRVFNGNRSLITNTTVQVKEFQINESWCKDDFTQQLSGAYNHLAQEWLRTGIDSFDPSGTPIATIIDNVLSNALRLDVFRRASFAAGNSSDDDYNQFDGFWDRLIDSSGGSNYCVVRASATNGAGAVGFGTGSLAQNAALTALESAYANSNILLKDWDNIYAQFGGQVQKPVFWVTRSVWDNYYNSLIGTGAVTEQAFENLQKGLQTLTYKGYAVRPVSLWDQFLAESDNPLTGTTRHLIAFTTRDNHILGVENGADLNKIDGWYERKDRKYYFEGNMKMGYNYLHCDLQTIVY